MGKLTAWNYFIRKKIKSRKLNKMKKRFNAAKDFQAGLTASQLTGVCSKRPGPLVIGGPIRCRDCIALGFGSVARKVGCFLRKILGRAY